MSQVMKQKDAVYTTTMNVLAENNVPFDDGQEGGVEKVVSKEIRASIIGAVTSAILAGEVVMSADGLAKYDTEDKMRGYVSGLVSNWFRKDSRLNGNVKYEIKNPGSRAGAGDSQMKALKDLRAAKADDEAAVKVIDEAIEKRKNELKATKTVEITEETIAALPEDVRAKLGL